VALHDRRVREAHPQLAGGLLFQSGEAGVDFWDMAMALKAELASFNIVVEKCQGLEIGGKTGAD
jgi:hypothetical protein